MNLTPLLLKRFASEPASVGKFHVSAIWGIVNNYTSVKDYLEGKENDFDACLRMWNGVGKHQQIQLLFEDNPEYEIEKRVEYHPPYEWYVVGKADLLTKDQVIEIKTSSELMPEAKKWHIDQVKLYLTMFQKPEGIIVQPIIKSGGVELKEIGRVKRNDKWTEEQMEKLDKFYAQIKKYQKKQKPKKDTL